MLPQKFYKHNYFSDFCPVLHQIICVVDKDTALVVIYTYKTINNGITTHTLAYN